MIIISAITDVAHAESFENSEFSIEYPDNWALEDNWKSAKHMLFTSESDSTSHIMVEFHTKYPLVGTSGGGGKNDKTLDITQVSIDTVDAIVADAAKRCRVNIDGPCWSFDVTDSRITTITYKRAALVDYDARINDADVSVRLLVLPVESGVWIVRGVALTDADATAIVQQTHNSLATFEPVSINDSDEKQKSDTSSLKEPLQWEPEDPELTLEKTLRVNMIMIGQEWSSLDVTHILEALPASHEPIFTTTGQKVGIKYNYEYNFVSDVKNTDELVRIMDDHSYDHPVLGRGVIEDYEFWHATWLKDHPELRDMPYRLVDADVVEDYVHGAIIGADPSLDAGVSSTINLVFLNINPDVMSHIQNYYMETADRTTGKVVRYTGLMGFGSSHDTFFFDLWSLPWIDPDLEYLYWSPSYTENLHDCQESRCLTEIVSKHTESAIYHILTPSFLYPVTFNEDYFLDVLLYLKPGGRTTVTPSVLDHFMNKDQIINELEYLYPFAGWDIEVSIERKDMRGLSYEFKTQLERVTREQVDVLGQTITYAYLNSSEIKPYLIEWAQQRQTSLVNGTWSIPMLVVLDNTETEVLLDNGAIGIAPGMPDDESQPCCAFAVADAADVWENKLGLDNIIMHEVGHIMGLHHPFAAYTYGEATYNFYYNWYSSPMTYSSPDGWGACGLLYNVFYESPCGNADPSFTVFERERLADARLVSLIKDINMETNVMPADIAEIVRGNLTDIKKTFATGDTLSETGALQSALNLYSMIQHADDTNNTSTSKAVKDSHNEQAAFEKADTTSTDTSISNDTIVDVEEDNDGMLAIPSDGSDVKEDRPLVDNNTSVNNTSVNNTSVNNTSIDHEQINTPSTIEQTTTSTLSAWIKNSAGWWADGLIDDLEFISSIEYMIEHDIIITDVQELETSNNDDLDMQSIPSWIKNSAGWWADGLITDEEFIDSVRYMITIGIIHI